MGRRSLVNALSLLMAEGKGPVGLSKLVQVTENALLVDSEKAIDHAYQQARDGILFIPNIERFRRHAMSLAGVPQGDAAGAAGLPEPLTRGDRLDHRYGVERTVGGGQRTARDNCHRMHVPSRRSTRRSPSWGCIGRGSRATTA